MPELGAKILPIQSLTAKQERFCQEFLKDLNGTAAARRAGYTGNANALGVTAHDLLRNPKIQAEVKRLMDKRAERVQITADFVLQNLATIAITAESDSAKVSALGLIGKHLGLFTEQGGTGGAPAGVEVIHAILYEHLPEDVKAAEKLTGKSLAELKRENNIS